MLFWPVTVLTLWVMGYWVGKCIWRKARIPKLRDQGAAGGKAPGFRNLVKHTPPHTATIPGFTPRRRGLGQRDPV